MKRKAGYSEDGRGLLLVRSGVGRAIVLSAIGLVGACNPLESKDARTWSESTAAPAEFRFWAEAKLAIELPAGREEFLAYARSSGGEFVVTGEGQEAGVPAPHPRPGSLCVKTDKAILVYFDSPNEKVGPRYVAYLGNGQIVECIEPQFEYAVY